MHIPVLKLNTSLVLKTNPVGVSETIGNSNVIVLLTPTGLVFRTSEVLSFRTGMFSLRDSALSVVLETIHNYVIVKCRALFKINPNLNLLNPTGHVMHQQV